MNVVESWLRSWVNPDISTDEMVAQLTMAGLEVDGVESAADDFSKVVVAEILSAEKHPEADKLQVCSVNDGTDTVQIVCGAPNARAGIKVALAQVGAKFADGFKIKKAKLRGVESFGMLCSAKELGISDDHEGIMELPADLALGTDLRDALNLDDKIIDIDLTPNRGDCLSIRGIAREVAVFNALPAPTGPEIEAVEASIEDTFNVELSAPDACPRYVGRVIKNVDVTKPSPAWMVERLERSGLRSIDPVVDITNYIMLELGQPMHGFDLDTLKGGINVRMAKAGEQLTLLDGQEVILKDNVLLIADEARPLAMAGIMGGEDTGVSATTKNVFFESAWFNPIAIAGRARSFGLHTDSSHRFERGVDPALAELAIERATALLLDICGGEAGPVEITEVEDNLPKQATITLRKHRIKDLLNLELADDEVERMLTGLGLEMTARSSEGWIFKAPSWRFDMEIEEDLLEELARLYGYNNVPITAPVASLAPKAQDESKVALSALQNQLLNLGYQEVITYSFVPEKVQAVMDPDVEVTKLANPITNELAVMRTTLWSGLVQTLEYNQKRQQGRVRIMETGLAFRGDEQPRCIAGLAYGTRLPKGWFGNDDVDFYDVKADVEALLAHSRGHEVSFVAGSHKALHPGQTAQVLVDGKPAGYLGALHPSVLQALDLKGPVFVFELRLDAFDHAQLAQAKPLSKYPETSRDLAIIADQHTPVAPMLASAQQAAGEFATKVTLFDVYQGKGVQEGKKSIAFGLTWQSDERTLNDDEINAAVESVLSTLKADYQAVLRG
ncbi:phenylalanine--tRNA ligase subunit beta [Salinibius halmophilus]|uniref:phenylalanine--tRNA ligase subunit beta n=1 Tax=Salinibius halmophilus TaxID=1853216 RepID=UPI000E66380C|nr:phenylalanine--tRNA ligase subunit beta [Salinibius halmophilus]